MIKNYQILLNICIFMLTFNKIVLCDDKNVFDDSDDNYENKGNVYNNKEIYYENSGETCYRKCLKNDKRTCYYKWILQFYHAMGPACKGCAKGNFKECNDPQCIIADGIEKGVMSINRQIPGPAIHACKGDKIVVDVVNQAGGTAASIHWHGFHMRDTPFMDGVPFLTQCPISFSNTFRYKFYATQPGTQFYHSHSGHHKVSGQYGGIVVREPNGDDPNSNAYDYDLVEHLIIISDWMHETPEMFMPGLPTKPPGIAPESVLINGRGQYIDPVTKLRTNVPPATFEVKQGKRYRFRLINSGSHSCPYQIQIEGHNMTVIATDSFNVEPKLFTTLVTNAGERYDFILNAKKSIKNYLIRVRGLGLCTTKPIESFAILSYKDINVKPPIYPSYDEIFPNGILLNHPNSTCNEDSDEHCVSELRSTTFDDDLRYDKPDNTYYLGFSIQAVSNDDVFRKNVNNYNTFINFGGNFTGVGTINRLTHVFPSFPPLTQPNDLHSIDFCELGKMPEHCKNYTICPCVHRIKVPLNAVVELVIVDETPTTGRVHHPFHMHGYAFMVVGLGQHPLGIPMTVDLAKTMNRARILPRIAINPRPPLKDTISIPSRGYAILKFRADNPGFWLLHCHYEWHMTAGMGLIVQVGEPENMVKPPSKFPKCGNFLPNFS